jgi:hypothetical protein
MAGKKTFVAGEVLLAQDVNDYLMDQSVMTFASDAARSSAIPTPTEGMFAVTTDNDQLNYYNGSAWVNATSMAEWTAYTPTFGGVTVGNGTTSFFYNRIGKTVFVKGKFTLQSTSAITGSISVSFPFTARNNIAVFSINGNVMFFNNSVILQGQSYYGSSSVNLQALVLSGGYVTGTPTSSSVPFTWLNGHSFSVEFVFEAV